MQIACNQKKHKNAQKGDMTRGRYNFTVDDSVRIYFVRVHHRKSQAYTKRKKQYSFASFG